MIENLNSLRKSLHKQTSNLENVVDELRNCFSPHQIMKFLLLVENVKIIYVIYFKLIKFQDKANKFLNPAKLWFKKQNVNLNNLFLIIIYFIY